MQKQINKDLLAQQVKVVKVMSYFPVLLLSIILSVTYFVFDEKQYLPLILLPYFCGVFLNIALYQYHKKIMITYQALMILSYAAMIAISSVTGGIYSPFVFVFIILPLNAFFTRRKQGRYWFIIATLTIIALYVLEHLKFPYINIIAEAYQSHFILAIILYVFFVCSVSSFLVTRSSFKLYRRKEVVDEKNRIISESINYARRIQEAILPSEKSILREFPESFIYFQPRDVVSGDFYWYSKQNNKSIIAAVDCTGHGVPGAFMSMIGNTLLNEIVNEKKIYQPDQILKNLNEGIINALHQREGNIESQDDGMVISLCAFTPPGKGKNSSVFEFAEANQPVYLVNDSKIEEIPGDLDGIGGMLGSADRKFTNHSLKLSKGTTIYMTSDGFPDQFGGEHFRKFSSDRFAKVLLDIQRLGMKRQKEELNVIFNDWKGINKQIDDVLVIGIRI